MSMEYGTLIVCGDYEGTLHGIADVLNCWDFDQDGALKFAVADTPGRRPRISPSVVSAAYPTAWPQRTRYLFKDSNPVFSDQVTDPRLFEYLRQTCDNTVEEQVDLEIISDRVTPYLTSGTLELAVVAREKLFHVCWNSLCIRANGSVEARSQIFFGW